MRGLVLGIAAVIAALVLSAASMVPPAVAAESDDRLKLAAQHFADIEDDQARAILEDLSAEGVAEADVLLGYLFSDPLNEGRDYAAAVAAFKRSADDEEATFQLAEARFWPDYSNWTLTAKEEAIRPSAREALALLKRAGGEEKDRTRGHNASKWRLAYLCTFGGYDCGKEATDQAIKNSRRLWGDNLMRITGSFRILEILRSGEAEKAGTMKVFYPYLSLGYADADPFVADAATAFVWRDVSSAEDCPPVDGFLARGRFLATQNDVATHYEERLDLEDCYSVEQMEALHEDAVASLDVLASGFGNVRGSWHLRRCYHEQEAPSFGSCLIHAVRHHFFACTKLSLPAYYKRFGIEYRHSKRYEQCREMMLGYPILYNRI